MSKYFKVSYDDTQLWRTSELVNFVNSIKNKATIQELSAIYRRSPSCIKAKLNNIAADYYFSDPAVFKQIQDLTGIKEADFLVQRFTPPSVPKCAIEIETEQMTLTPPPEVVEPNSISTQTDNTDICTMIAYNILDSITGIRVLVHDYRKKIKDREPPL